MKRYEFHSALPPEKVFARLDANAKRGRCYIWEFGAFFYVRKGERFRLRYAERRFKRRGPAPFSGAVRAEGAGSVISGGFSSLWELSEHIAAGGIILALEAWTVYPPPLLMVGWLLLVLGVFSAKQLAAFRKRQKIIVKFIEDNLLK